MLRTYFTFSILLFLGVLLYSQERTFENPDYYGEKLEYELRAGFFQIGEVDIEFRGDSAGCDAFLQCNARSTGLVNFIKDVKYYFDACVDTSIGYTIEGSRSIKEGSFTDYDLVIYDRFSREDSTIIITEDFDTIIAPKDIYDVFVAFFQFRKNFVNADMPVGTVTYLKTFFVDVEWDLFIKYDGMEKIKTKFGEVTCYKFLPRTEVGRYFKTEEDMAIWVTANRHLIPVKFEVKLKVATLHADIENYVLPIASRKQK